MKIDIMPDEERLIAWTGYAAREVMKSIPGGRWNKEHMAWTYPMIYPSVVSLVEAANFLRESVQSSDRAKEWAAAEAGRWAMLFDMAADVRGGREPWDGESPMPTFFPHQLQGADWLSADGAEGGRLDAGETGCLTGDTLLTVNRGGRGFTLRLDDLVHRFNGGATGAFGRSSRWDPAIPTKVSYRDPENGSVRSGAIKAAWVSGMKEVFEIVTETGQRIRASATHPFLTKDGWAEVSELNVGDEVYVNIGKGGWERKPKNIYRMSYVPASHPFATPSTTVPGKRVQYRIGTHRLTAEAALNGMTLQEFQRALRDGETEFDFIDPAKFHVHHKDEDHLNNSPENLEVLSVSEHSKHHVRPEAVLYRTGLSRIVSITPRGEEMTYDIEMESEPHNYLANGFVVHNSGKTRATLRAAWECWNAGETGVLLISTMASVKHGWASEVERIKDELPLPDGAQWDVRVLRGTAPQRRKMFDALPDDGVGVVLITNHEQLKIHSRLSGYGDVKLNRCEACGGGAEAVKEASCHAHEKELNKIKMVALVIDEAHRFLNARAQQTRAGWYLADHAPRKWALTGTPGSTSVVENTWALLRLVVGEKWPSKSKWCEYFAHTGYNIEGYWEVGNLKPEREDEFRKMYGSLTRRVLKAQVLDLPPLLRGGSLERVLTMGTAQAAAYAQMRDELMVQIEDGTVTAGNILAQTTRLIQLAQACGMPGPLYGQVIGQDKEGNDIIDSTMNLTAPSCKVDAVVDMVKSGDVGPGTVFQFVSAQLLFMVRDALVAKGLIREHEFGAVAGPVKEYARGVAIDKFQSGKIPFFGFTVAAGGAGITLTRSNTMVAVERPWSPVLWKQAEDRVHRIGSEIHESVSIIDLITEDTVETRQIERVLGNKESLEAIVQDRAKLKELLS